MSDAERAAPSAECCCVGNCVGYECIRQRCASLMTTGRPADARQLAARALRDEREGPMAEELRGMYDDVVAAASAADRPSPHPSVPASPARSPAAARDDDADSPDSTPNAARPPERRQSPVSDLAMEFECVLCSKLLYEPVTTPCGHSFCRSCLVRAIDRTPHPACPMCRTVLHMEDPTALPITVVLRNAIQQCYPHKYEIRRREAEAETPSAENAMNRLPLFPLNAVVFPMQRFPMHIFEPRYRLMLRRIMLGSRKFGLIALKRTKEGTSELCNVGCVLEVTKAERFPDGRSLIETTARERFLVQGRTEVDGYLVGRTTVYEDNEDTDTEEVAQVEARVRSIVENLMEKGSQLPTTQHALQRAGDVPSKSQGPAALGMWLAGMLVSDDSERQNMLEMRNSATRLKEMVAILERFRDSMTATANANGDGGRDCCIQ